MSPAAAAPPHAAFRTLPIVDVAPLHSTDVESRRRAAKALGEATREAGFFYAVGHSISALRTARLVERAEAFFALPLERKMEYYIGNSPNHRGYVPEGEEVFYGGTRDRKEAFDLALDLPADDPEVLRGTPMLGPNVWPDVPGFREDVAAYYSEAFELGRTLFRGFALSLGLPEAYFEQFVRKPPSQLRLVHYPRALAGEATTGIGAHTDYECFTILLPTAPGLEVMNGAGEWIDAPPADGAFVVNIGDLLEIWTNGEFVATSHRVRRVDQERYSFPLFCCCDYDTEVRPLAPFVDAARPAAHAPVRAGDHLFAQTAQSFRYMKERMARGEAVLPDDARPLSSFGQEGRRLGAGRDAEE